MLGRNRRKIWLALIITAVVAIGAAVLFAFLQRSNNATQPSAQSPESQYQQLKQACVDSYQEGLRRGNRYFRYPCTDTDIRRQYQEKYGHEYTGKPQ